MSYDKKQETGGDCTTSPGDKIRGSREHKPGPIGLDSNGGSSSRGSGNEKR